MTLLTSSSTATALPSRPRCAVVFALTTTFFLAACASSTASSGGLMDKALDMVGLQAKPATPDLSKMDAQGMPAFPKMSKKITLRIHAGEVLNTDSAGRSLALVAKIYKLSDVDALLQTPYDTLTGSAGTKPAQLAGVLDVREIVLTPGQKYEVVETLPPEATHLAVVGLFRAPDERRWRFVFDANTVAKAGVTIGAHGCAFSVSEGQPVAATAETMRLAGVRCR